MEVVGVIVDAKLHNLAVQGEGSVLHPVGVAGNGGTQEGAAGEVAGCIVAAKHNVCDIALCVGNQKLYQGSTAVCEGGSELATRYGIQGRFLAGGENSEFFSHRNGSFHFYAENRDNYVDMDLPNYTIFCVSFQTFILWKRWKLQLSSFFAAKRERQENRIFSYLYR